MKFGTSSKIASLTLLASAVLVAQGANAAASEDAQRIAASYDRFSEAEAQFGFLRENCMECHNAEDWAGSLAFDLISPDEIARHHRE